MTNFLDGPAKGHHLMLTRAPHFLRVTEDAGIFDALNQPEDTPKVSEKLYAYVMVGTPGMCHINRGRNGSGMFTVATYQSVETQPDDKTMRDAALWRAWCYEQPEAKQ